MMTEMRGTTTTDIRGSSRRGLGLIVNHMVAFGLSNITILKKSY